MIEPQPPDPSWPRYTATTFPPYRFVPGRNPHPRRNQRGHSYGRPEPRVEPFAPEAWPQAEAYLYGIDLYNYAYWWECHEVFESYWHAVGPKTEQGNFFQALIQLAAALLKQHLKNVEATANLAHSGAVQLEKLPPHYMGVKVHRLAEEARSYFNGDGTDPPLIRLSPMAE